MSRVVAWIVVVMVALSMVAYFAVLLPGAGR